MPDSPTKPSQARSEAAQWFTRLSRLSVTTDTLRDFRDWKKQDGNAQAYAQVEETWRKAGGLSADPEIHRLMQTTLQRRPAKTLRRRPGAMLGLGGLATTALAALLTAGWFGAEWHSYSTGVGEQRLLVLEDGSRVRLNTDSRIRVRFSRRERDIALLRGEAFFEAAHNPARPFIVSADGARVRAIGTKFDVRRDDRQVQVTLVEGKVQVADDNVARTLLPDQQLTASPSGISAPRPADPVQATGWTRGRLIFRALPLQQAVAEVNRYAVHKIALDAPSTLKARPVSGVFDTGDTGAFVAAVGTLFDLHAATGPDGAIRLSPAAPRPKA